MSEFSTEGPTGTPAGTADVPAGGDRALVVGLGNPGPGYAGNRHNIGFGVLDELARHTGGGFRAHKAGAATLEGRIAGAPVVLAKPSSYMNASGGPVAGLARFYKIDPGGIVVVHDELDLDFGAIRLKFGGGISGHNGLRSVSKSLDTRDYYRVRFGLGRPPGRADPADYVLSNFSSTERRDLAVHIGTCVDALLTLLAKGLAAAQTEFHTR